MRKVLYAVFVLTATAALGLPKGLSGLGVNFGGMFGDVDDGIVGCEFDFGLPPYVAIGPEFNLGFGDATVILAGAETRIYFMPQYKFIIQPNALIGGGFGHAIIEDAEDSSGGYIHFGGGMDFDLPQGPITPFFDVGGIIAIGSDTLAMFALEGGIRVAVW